MQTILIDGKPIEKSNYELVKTEIKDKKELYRRLKEQHPNSITNQRNCLTTNDKLNLVREKLDYKKLEITALKDIIESKNVVIILRTKFFIHVRKQFIHVRKQVEEERQLQFAYKNRYRNQLYITLVFGIIIVMLLIQIKFLIFK